jgi:protein-L-isoaspartate(D-aspartate) O-methyltransferase
MRPRFLRPAALLLSVVVLLSTGAAAPRPLPPAPGAASPQVPPQHEYRRAQDRMVREHIAARGVRDRRVLEAMRRVPRHLFVRPDLAHRAYEDNPLPTESGQTISQPYIVALMTELARPQPGHVALEIGTGSGYQAAVLADLVARVYTVELLPHLAASAAERLRKLGYDNVHVRQGDGYQGWAEHAPYDVILVTAAPEEIPAALVDQLKPGGRMVIPTGRAGSQHLRVVEKRDDGSIRVRSVAPVAFVPLVPAR